MTETHENITKELELSKFAYEDLQRSKNDVQNELASMKDVIILLFYILFQLFGVIKYLFMVQMMTGQLTADAEKIIKIETQVHKISFIDLIYSFIY